MSDTYLATGLTPVVINMDKLQKVDILTGVSGHTASHEDYFFSFGSIHADYGGIEHLFSSRSHRL